MITHLRTDDYKSVYFLLQGKQVYVEHFQGFIVIPSSLREVLINSEANASNDELITSRWSEVKGHCDLLNTDLIVWIF